MQPDETPGMQPDETPGMQPDETPGMQPDETPGEIRDSVVTDDVHHQHYQQADQIQSDPWAGQQPEHKQPEAVMMGNVSEQPSVLGQQMGMPGQVIMVQQPSSAAKVIGILAIILGCIGVLFGLKPIVDSLSYSSVAIPLVIAILGLVGNAAFILGGYWMTNYQRRGVQLVLLAVIVGFSTMAGSVLILDDLMQEELDNGNMTQEDYDATLGIMAILGAAVMAISAVCYGICGLIVAIPLMSANGGLDESSLFSSSSIN